MGLGKCLPQDQPPKRYLSRGEICTFFEEEKTHSSSFFWESEIVFAVSGPIGHPGAVGVPKKAVFMTPNWLFTGKSVILVFSNSLHEFLVCLKHLDYCKISPLLRVFETIQTFLFMLYPCEI